jgi:hypothetical protein
MVLRFFVWVKVWMLTALRYPSGISFGQNHLELLELGCMLPPCGYCNKPENIAQSHGNSWFKRKFPLLHRVEVSSTHAKQRRGDIILYTETKLSYSDPLLQLRY